MRLLQGLSELIYKKCMEQCLMLFNSYVRVSYCY